MYHAAKLACVLACSIVATGCSTMAPSYSASLSNVEQLKADSEFTAKVGAFTADPGQAHDDGISLRGTEMKSPVNGSYASYLAEALKQELSVARKLAPDAEIEVSGILLKNDVDVGSFSTGHGDIQARFIIKRGGVVRYDATKSQHSEWDSSFVGAVAIPKGMQAYPSLVQGLLGQLYADPAFVAAVK
jgi:hypothetical protein